MADDYKYKNLPRAANGIAPAYWDEEEKQWLPYEGGADMVKELNDIKATQAKILERLDKPLDTQVTGSNVEEGIDVKLIGSNTETEIDRNVIISKGSSKGYIVDLDANKFMIGLFAEENPDINIKVDYRLRSSDGRWLSSSTSLIDDLTILYGVSDITNVKTPQAYFVVRNQSDTEDLTIERLYIYKMR